LNQSNNFDIDGPEAWDITTGSNDVVIAIVDQGINYNHDDFGGAVLGPYPNEKVVAGYNFANGVPDPMFNQTVHGNHVAGIAAGLTNNGANIAGVAGGSGGSDLGSKIMPIYVSLTTSSIAQGIEFARVNGADVINVSFQAYEFSQALHDACWNAYLQGVTLGDCPYLS
jgi:thermitase